LSFLVDKNHRCTSCTDVRKYLGRNIPLSDLVIKSPGLNYYIV